MSDNIGETGVKSIRLGGMRIANLPIAEHAGAIHQLPLAIDTERKNNIENIVAGSPKARVPYLESRMIECRENITRINVLRAEQMQKIAEYTAQLSMCKYRDTEIDKIPDDDSDRDVKIKKMFKLFPPYDVKAMEQQVKQFEEGITRCDDVIKKENESLLELNGVMQLCMKRDKDLKNLGAKIE